MIDIYYYWVIIFCIALSFFYKYSIILNILHVNLKGRSKYKYETISQNVIGTKEVLEKLKDSDISEEQLLLLTDSVTEQINQITISRKMEGKDNNILIYGSSISETSVNANKKKLKKI